MVARPRHQDKDIEAFLRDLEKHGWSVSKGKKYYKARCPCGEHQKGVHLTPSGRKYLKNSKKYLARNTCWEGES